MPRRGIYLGPPRTGIVKFTRYRSLKTGRVISKKEAERRTKISRALSHRKRPKRVVEKETYQYRITEMGEWETGIRLPRVKTVTRIISQIALNKWGGMIKEAMYANNVMTQIPDARIIDFEIRGYVRKRLYVLRKSIDTRFVRKRKMLNRLSVSELITMLHTEGFRVDYPLEIVRWTGKQTRRYQSKAMSILKNATITIRVRK